MLHCFADDVAYRDDALELLLEEDRGAGARGERGGLGTAVPGRGTKVYNRDNRLPECCEARYERRVTPEEGREWRQESCGAG